MKTQVTKAHAAATDVKDRTMVPAIGHRWRMSMTHLKASLKTATLLLLLAASATLASANNIPIPGLCSTGMNSTCSGPATIGSQDSNWSLATPYPSSGSGQSLPAPPWNLTYGPAYVNGPDSGWLPNSSTSQWTTPLSTFSVGGNYVYATSFNIPAGYDPATASISGFWTSDNEGIAVWLNQQQITNFPLPGPGDFNQPFPFTIDSSNATFQSGLNTLFFEVRNRGVGGDDGSATDTGIRVEFTSGSVGETPEPSSVLLMGSGLVGLAGVVRRKLRA